MSVPRTDRTDVDAFVAFEAAGWERIGDTYHRFFGPITGRVVEPLLDAAAVGPGTRVLDVATGPGYAAARAAARGADATGVDIAPGMVALARRRWPDVAFRTADAHRLPFADASFDAVVANFLIPHLADHEQAVDEFARVLEAGGRLALTTWDQPERSRLLGAFVDALRLAGAGPPPDLPTGPDLFRYADDDAFADLLRGGEFEGVTVRRIASPSGCRRQPHCGTVCSTAPSASPRSCAHSRHTPSGGSAEPSSQPWSATASPTGSNSPCPSSSPPDDGGETSRAGARRHAWRPPSNRPRRRVEGAHMSSTLTDQPTRAHARTLLVAALAIGLALPWRAPAIADGPPAQETADVLTFAGFEPVEDATARLVRGDDTLFTRTDTRELDDRHVMTLWWVIFNHPEHCAHGQGDLACGEGDLFDSPDGPTGVEPACVFADGSLVGGNGHARFTDRLVTGEARDSCIDFFVDAVDGLDGADHGLTNPAGAEVHLVVRSHGPRIPGAVAEQRSTFAGGCEAFLDPGATHELEPGECSDLQFAVFPAGD